MLSLSDKQSSKINVYYMNIQTFEFNPVSENTYVLYDETKECVIVDAGCFFPEEKAELAHFIESNDLQVKHIINTHLHFDHVLGLNFVLDKYNLPLEAHKGDEPLLQQLKSQLQMFGFSDTGEPIPQISKFLTEEDTIEFGNQRFQIFHVPGHSLGSIVFYNEKEKCAFVGDVLFQGSIGRTDLVGGNYDQLITGIKSKLLPLPEDTIVYPGHGPSTTIGFEKQNNPFLK